MRKIILEGERPVSWNKFYAGMHWSRRREYAAGVHYLVKLAARGTGGGLFMEKVAITITVFFKNRPLDPCNIPAKIYIDGLLGTWLIDDSPRYVSSVTTRSRVDKERPRVEIVVEETG